MSERIIYPIYRHLKGKRILIVDSLQGDFYEELYTNLSQIQEMNVVYGMVMEFSTETSLSERMKKGEFDIAVFHAAGPIDTKSVLHAKENGHNVIVLERYLGEKDTEDIFGLREQYNKIIKAGIPTCIKYGNERNITLDLVNILAGILD